LPLRLGQVYAARVRAIRDRANSPIEPGTMVLSADPATAGVLPSVGVGTILRLSTATIPALTEIQAAISGGPALVLDGKASWMRTGTSNGYESGSARIRHPRAAVGWNQRYFFLVVVDGRQRLSAGMTLDELSGFLMQLGCEQAMNLDGGGSATLCYSGEVRNSPCERAEREISNGLLLVRKGPPEGP